MQAHILEEAQIPKNRVTGIVTDYSKMEEVLRRATLMKRRPWEIMKEQKQSAKREKELKEQLEELRKLQDPPPTKKPRRRQH